MRIVFRLLILLFLCLSLLPARDAAAEEADGRRLLVCHLEFPPYYYTTTGGEPDGFLLRKADAILRLAGIRPVYQSMPAKRIMQLMHAEEPVCSIGWFRTPQREGFARFSKPIYRNEPLHALYLARNGAAFEGKTTLAEIVADKTIVLGLLEGYSLGAEVDEIIASGRPGMRRINGDYAQMVRMLAMERFTCILVAPEEVESLIRKNRLPEDIFASMPLADVPSGNERHLMFSLAVPDDVVARVDQAIEAVDAVDGPAAP
jgi:polar amino acid transport system substrate-binding protein